MGDDDLLYPRALSTLAAAIDRYPNAGIYAFGYTIIDEFDHVRYSRQAPRPLRVSIGDPDLARELVVSDIFPFWMYHPATFCAHRDVHRTIKSNLDVGIGDDFMFMIDFINAGGVVQIIPAVLMCYRKASSTALHRQPNLSAGELPHLVARAKIMRQLSGRTDLHPAIASFARSEECRKRLLYDPILWSGLGLADLQQKLDLDAQTVGELSRYARRRPRALHRGWLSLRRAMTFCGIFGITGVLEMSRVLLQRRPGRKTTPIGLVEVP
jgi:hypothetical protein